MRKTLLRLVFLALLAPSFSAIASARAVDAGGGGGNSEVDAAAAPDVAEDLERTADEIRALIAGQLDAEVNPASLFEVALVDEAAVRIEAARLRALLRGVATTAPGKKEAATHRRARDADAGVPNSALERARWNARLDLDRARLAFYELPAARRREILTAHAVRHGDAAAPPSEADLRERQAEQQRQEALRTAQSARTEAERAVAAELARLLDVERAQAALAEVFAHRKKEIAERQDATIGWQHKALDAHAHPGSSADATYDDLRRALRSARDALSQALEQLGAPSEVPGPGPDALTDLRVDVDTSAARKERSRVETESQRLRAEEESIRRERAAQLFDEIDTLNSERLALLPVLSPAKRAAITGFTSAAGWGQAASEARQLALILRYHRYIIGQWILTLRDPGRALGGALAGGMVNAFEWLLALGIFVWWRRRSKTLLRVWHRQAIEADRRARLLEPSPASRALGFLVQAHRPIEWLALLFILRWLLPVSTQHVLEVRVLSTLMMWIFGAAFVVDVVNALAGGRANDSRYRDEPDTAALRLRSLRLVARVVVIFGLILVLSSMLVGRGTIYQWVFSTCWLTSIPILLVLVRWWRDIVFRRTERIRKPTRIQRWVLANSQGWSTSFAAAAVGGLYLFGSGAIRGARNWIGRFVITRRALAYLFRRQLGKREQTEVMGPIPDAAFASLGPEHPSARWIATDAETPLGRLAVRIRNRKGGVIAIVGERGMGKTTALRHVRGDGADSILIDSFSFDPDALHRSLAERAGLARTASLEQAASALAASAEIHALLLDDAQHFVRPVVGGLVTFDRLLAIASRHTNTTTCVFALDHVIWQFLERSRGARPHFDEVIFLQPWGEERIVNLLKARTEEAGLSPSFESLLEPLPATADDVDRQEALARRAADYFRLLWDAATGNPGVALHMWRRSLGTNEKGETSVRPSVALDTSDLERLPDSSVFVLRAVLQLAPARAEQIAEGGVLRLADVADALRYAASRGYIEEHDGGYRVTWTWFRAITLFLQRKHLLTTSTS